jgi:hypothetical protein
MKDRSKLSVWIVFILTVSLLLCAAAKSSTAYAQQKAQIFVQLGHTVALGRGLSLFAGLPRSLDLRLVSTAAFRAGAVAQIYRPA